MKKLLFFLAVSLLAFSCSDRDDYVDPVEEHLQQIRNYDVYCLAQTIVGRWNYASGIKDYDLYCLGQLINGGSLAYLDEIRGRDIYCIARIILGYGDYVSQIGSRDWYCIGQILLGNYRYVEDISRENDDLYFLGMVIIDTGY